MLFPSYLILQRKTSNGPCLSTISSRGFPEAFKLFGKLGFSIFKHKNGILQALRFLLLPSPAYFLKALQVFPSTVGQEGVFLVAGGLADLPQPLSQMPQNLLKVNLSMLFTA